MRVLIVAPKLSGGGAEKTAANLANMLVRRHEVCLATTSHDAADVYELSPKVRRLRVEPCKVEVPSPALSRREAGLIASLRHLKQTYGIDASIGFLERASFLNAASRTDERVITAVRNSYCAKQPAEPSPERYRFWCEQSLARADEVVAISKGVASELVRCWGLPVSKVHTIYNPCDIRKLRRLARKPLDADIAEFACGAPMLASVGRLVPQKGHGRLLEAFSRARRQGLRARLLIVGKGPLECDLAAQAEALGIADTVMFAGWRDNPFPAIAASAALLCSSEYEGLGNVLLEALAVGTPVISADCKYGPRELLLGRSDYGEPVVRGENAGAGLVCPTCRDEDWPDVFALQLCEFMESPALAADVRRAGVVRARDFKPRDICAQWNEVIGA